MRLILPKGMLEPHASGGPSDYPSIDCFLVDVNGPGVDAMYDEGSPFSILELGLNTAWVSRTDLIAAGSTTLSVRVPIGRSRTIRILGIKGASAITDCAARSFSGYPSSGVLKQPPYPLVYELARSTVDVYTAKTVQADTATDPSVDMMPSNQLTASPQSYFVQGNTDPDYPDGAPPASGPFQSYIAPSSSDSLSNRTRFDVVLNINNQNVKPYRGLQVAFQAQGGDATCSTTFPSINTPSDLVLALWDEGSGTWIEKGVVVPSTQQAFNHTVTFSGLNFESLRTTVTDGTAYQGLWLSLRVKDAPSGGCSAVNLMGISATLFQ